MATKEKYSWQEFKKDAWTLSKVMLWLILGVVFFRSCALLMDSNQLNNKCLNNLYISEDEEKTCFNSAENLDFWFFTTENTDALKLVVVKGHIFRGEYGTAKAKAKDWDLNVYDIANNFVADNFDDLYYWDEALAAFKHYKMTTYVISTSRLMTLTNSNDCDQENYASPRCMELIKVAKTYNLPIVAYGLAIKSWELLLKKRDNIYDTDLQAFWEATHNTAILSYDQLRVLTLIYIVEMIGKSGTDEDKMVAMAREQGLLPELRKYVGISNPITRILIDYGFLFAD